MNEIPMSENHEATETRQQSRLNLLCFIAAGVFLALVAYNLLSTGNIISTDGLFFTVVPLVLALSLLAVPGMDMWAKRKQAQAAGAGSDSAETVEAEPAEDIHFAGTNRLFFMIWLWLLALTGLEVFLGYIHLSVILMLVILLGASIVKAALIVAYFMHLRFERLHLILTIVPAVVICICLLLVFFPDSFRSKGLRYEGPPAPPAASSEAH